LSYKKGEEVLPAHLLREVQKYIEGSLIYIPKASTKKGWGCVSGTKEALELRNQKILQLFNQGYRLEQLARDFFLSEETIKKLVYGKKRL